MSEEARLDRILTPGAINRLNAAQPHSFSLLRESHLELWKRNQELYAETQKPVWGLFVGGHFKGLVSGPDSYQVNVAVSEALKANKRLKYRGKDDLNDGGVRHFLKESGDQHYYNLDSCRIEVRRMGRIDAR